MSLRHSSCPGRLAEASRLSLIAVLFSLLGGSGARAVEVSGRSSTYLFADESARFELTCPDGPGCLLVVSLTGLDSDDAVFASSDARRARSRADTGNRHGLSDRH